MSKVIIASLISLMGQANPATTTDINASLTQSPPALDLPIADMQLSVPQVDTTQFAINTTSIELTASPITSFVSENIAQGSIISGSTMTSTAGLDATLTVFDSELTAGYASVVESGTLAGGTISVTSFASPFVQITAVPLSDSAFYFSGALLPLIARKLSKRRQLVKS